MPLIAAVLFISEVLAQGASPGASFCAMPKPECVDAYDELVGVLGKAHDRCEALESKLKVCAGGALPPPGDAQAALATAERDRDAARAERERARNELNAERDRHRKERDDLRREAGAARDDVQKAREAAAQVRGNAEAAVEQLSSYKGILQKALGALAERIAGNFRCAQISISLADSGAAGAELVGRVGSDQERNKAITLLEQSELSHLVVSRRIAVGSVQPGMCLLALTDAWLVAKSDPGVPKPSPHIFNHREVSTSGLMSRLPSASNCEAALVATKSHRNTLGEEPWGGEGIWIQQNGRLAICRRDGGRVERETVEPGSAKTEAWFVVAAETDSEGRQTIPSEIRKSPPPSNGKGKTSTDQGKGRSPAGKDGGVKSRTQKGSGTE